MASGQATFRDGTQYIPSCPNLTEADVGATSGQSPSVHAHAGNSETVCLVEILVQRCRFGRGSKLLHRLVLDLPDPLASEAELSANFVEGTRGVVV